MDTYTIIMLIVALAVFISSAIILIRGNIPLFLTGLFIFIGTLYLTFNPEILQ